MAASMSSSQLIAKGNRIKRWATVLGIGVIGFLVAPMIFLTIKGIIGLAIAAAIGAALIAFTPWYAMKLANWRLAAIKAEARKSPVETMQNVYNTKEQNLKDQNTRITEFSTKVKNFKDKIERFKTENANSKLVQQQVPRFEKQLEMMQALLMKRQKAYSDALKALKEYALTIQAADAIWQMTQESEALNEAANLTDDDFYEKLKAETAFDSVQESMNRSFAMLEQLMIQDESAESTTVLDDKGAPIMLENNPGVSLKIVGTQTAVPVPRDVR
jgi:hypothetical protein